MLRYFFCLLALLVLLSCSGRKSAPATAPEKVPPRLFRVEAPPGPMDDAQRYAYLREHFWDDLDFADTVLSFRPTRYICCVRSIRISGISLRKATHRLSRS